VLFSREDATRGKFAFTTETYDVFDVCFETKLAGFGSDREVPTPLTIHPHNELTLLYLTRAQVSLTMRRGVEARDYEKLAQAEKLKPLEVCFPLRHVFETLVEIVRVRAG